MARRFGVEIEFAGDMEAVIHSLRNAGIPVADMRHTHNGHSETAWTVKYDGSVSRGGELVSPPLDFNTQREQVTKAVEALQAAGATTDRAAGIHVHIEAVHEDGSLMTGREIAAVVRFTYKFEDAIYRIASSGWNTMRPGSRTYCRPIPEATARAIMEVKTRDELRGVWDEGRSVRDQRSGRYSSYILRALDRYTATNLQSLFLRNTIEFRYFNSSVNPVRIQTYIALCMAIVDDARNGYSRSVTKSYRLGDMANGTVKESAVILRLQQILRSNSRDTKVCMSEEDWKNLRKLCWKGSRPQQAF
jgi:hypothetical protein